MRRALELAGKAAGRTSPNPMVGAVIVKNGRVIAEGYHKKAGRPHGEIEALRKVGKQAKGAQMFVNLEPCCYQGRTPPCTDAIIESGIKELFLGMRDPNPRVAGKGSRIPTIPPFIRCDILPIGSCQPPGQPRWPIC